MSTWLSSIREPDHRVAAAGMRAVDLSSSAHALQSKSPTTSNSSPPQLPIRSPATSKFQKYKINFRGSGC